MSQRNVELLIGRLLTDGELRRRFIRQPTGTIDEFCREGWELTPGEIAALTDIDVRTWTECASGIPSRLKRCSLKTEVGG